MKKVLLLLFVVVMGSCSTQHKLKKSIENAKRMTMEDFKKGKIVVEYPSLNP
jgi:hypothetical protein